MGTLHRFAMKKVCWFFLILIACGIGCSSSDEQSPDDAMDETSTENEPTEDSGQNPEDSNDGGTSTFSSVVEEYGQLSVQGNKLVGQNEDVVQLRGMSLFWSQWIGKYYTPEVVKWLKDDWQSTVVRAALAVEHEGYLENPESEKQKIIAVIDAAIANGLYVIVDWHDHHAEDHLEESVAFFGELAEKYADYPNIIYEIYNEPLNVSWKNVLKPYHEAVIDEIRKYDADNIIVCGTPNWSQDVDDVIFEKIDDPNVMYTLHYYAATHKQELRDKALVALNNNIPVFVTEYGISEASGDGSLNETEAETWWSFLDTHQISHLNWSIADKEELSAALKPGASALGGWTTDELTLSGNIVRSHIRDKNTAY